MVVLVPELEEEEEESGWSWRGSSTATEVLNGLLNRNGQVSWIGECAAVGNDSDGFIRRLFLGTLNGRIET